jgi:hypothetical protein
LFGSFLAVMAADPDGAGLFVAALAAAVAAGNGYGLVGRVFVHEAGHLLAAVLVRLPVTAVRLRLFGGLSRVEVSLARLWQGRVAEARELSRDADHAGPEARATGLLVRALVELWSAGGADAAGPLLDKAVRAGCPPELAWLAGRLPWTFGVDRRA